MRGFERVGDLPGDRHRLVSRQRAVGQPIGERETIDELENQEGRGAVFLDAVDTTDMRMVQRREQLRLTREARVAFRIRANSAGSVLMATSRPSRVSRPRYTSPMPPWPSAHTTS